MDIIRSDGKLLEDMELDPKNTYMEVLQNVAIILASVQKSCPMVRNLGISGELHSRPLPIIENMLVSQIYDQIEEYEPRAIIGDITFETDDEKGMVIAAVELEGVQEEDE